MGEPVLGAVVGPTVPPCPPRGPRMTELERAAWRIALTFYGEEEAGAAECARDRRWTLCWYAVWDVLGGLSPDMATEIIATRPATPNPDDGAHDASTKASSGMNEND